MFEKLQSSIYCSTPPPQTQSSHWLPGLGNDTNLTNELVFQLFTALTRQLHKDQNVLYECEHLNVEMPIPNGRRDK